jgi:hypothetical protein
MSFPGKILLALCCVAALAFAVIAGADYTRRQDWTLALLRHDLALSGLPVDDDPKDDRFNALGTRALGAIFKDLGGEPVRTQLAEVQRVEQKVKADIQKQDDDAAQRARLETYWLALAMTNAERDAIRAKVRDANVPLDQMLGTGEGNFGDYFARARDPNTSRTLIAPLLYNVSQVSKATEQKAPLRAQTVVGLPAYVAAANRQIRALREMTQNVRRGIGEDRVTFEGKYQLYALDLQARDASLRDLGHSLTSRRAERNAWQEEVNKRNQLAAELKAEIDQARQAADKDVQKQTALEKELFDARRQLALALEQTQQLESQIRKLEQER